MTNEKVHLCRQTECPLKESGECLEGLNPVECSHAYWDTEQNGIDEQVEVSSPNSQMEGDTVANFALYSGNDLSLRNISLVTDRYNTNLILIIGESNSGKTTILTSIFDLFQIGGFDKFYFVGCLTPVGFETRCHRSRTASNNPTAETLKTTSNEFGFLHIAYKSVDSLKGAATHLLLSDISGERFQMANVSTGEMSEMRLLAVAEHLVYLLDCEKLIDPFATIGHRTRAALFIKRAIDARLFGKQTDLTIVFSKVDLLDNTGDQIIEEIIADLKNRFAEKLFRLDFIKIASRPKPPTEEFKFGFGLNELLIRWQEAKHGEANEDLIDSSEDERYFAKYKFYE